MADWDRVESFFRQGGVDFEVRDYDARGCTQREGFRDFQVGGVYCAHSECNVAHVPAGQTKAVKPPMTETNDTLVVGVDICGTKVASGLAKRDGEIRTQRRALRWWRMETRATVWRQWCPQSISFLPPMRRLAL